MPALDAATFRGARLFAIGYLAKFSTHSKTMTKVEGERLHSNADTCQTIVERDDKTNAASLDSAFIMKGESINCSGCV